MRSSISALARLFSQVNPKKRFYAIAVFAIIAVLGLTWHWQNTPDWKIAKEPVIVRILPGTAARYVPDALERAGISISRVLWRFSLFVTSAYDIHAGYYQILPDDSVLDILGKLKDKRAHLFSVRIAEGATFWEMLEAMRQAEGLKHDTQNMTAKGILEAVGAKEKHLEGLFHPETYRFHADISDLVILRQAYDAQKEILETLWKDRAADCAPKTPYEALILASIIEREVAISTDRYLVAGIFTNRLKYKMALQTDPSLIYGQGQKYGGKITRAVIDHDNPYNTYRYPGLPPTPIGMPSQESIHAALHPTKTDYLYFINKDDGELVPSRTLEEHNEAVNRYIRKTIK